MSIASRRIPAILCAVALCIPATVQAYGFAVHRMVNRAATGHLPPSFQGFAQWVDDLESLATAADERKCCVPGESIKHYIDIDDYPEFFTGTLPQAYDDMVAQYGQSRVDGNGTVPWAIDAAVQDLITHFQNEDWTNAVASAADIGHYIADTHNPMHLTLNFNGQLTGQNGIHSRHESEMTSRHLNDLEPAVGSVYQIQDPLGQVFTWIDGLYPGVQQILDADLIAEAAAGNTNSNAYYDRLWLEIGDETTVWIQQACIDLASVWYYAWIEAGAPALPGDVTGTDPTPVVAHTRVLANYPNPFNPSTRLRFELGQPGMVRLMVADTAGRTVRRMDLGDRAPGLHEIVWDGTGDDGQSLASGVYRVLVVDSVGEVGRGSVVLLK